MNKRRKSIIAISLSFCIVLSNMIFADTVTYASEQEGKEMTENDSVDWETRDNSPIVDDGNANEQTSTDADASQDSLEQIDVFSSTKEVLEGEDELKENSWRYSEGVLIPGISSRASSANAWNKVNGRYVNSRGEVISGAQKKGIDVSQHQGKIDWAKVKAAGIEFAIIRCGYGMDQADQDDRRWEYNVSECERLGIPYGVYIYSYATNTTRAASEAQHVLRLLKGHTPSYPVYFDMEDDSTKNLGKTVLGNIATTFCNKITSAGYKVGIYSNLDWRKNVLPTSVTQNSAWSQWVAQYNYKCDYAYDYDIWQCTSTGRVNGINGDVDLNFWMVATSDVEPIVGNDSNIVNYSSHLQSFGWQSEVKNGYQTGVTGYSKRMEAFKINVGSGYGDLGIEYSAHVQGTGWQSYVKNGSVAGTTGQSKAVEAIRIRLTGKEADKYDIYYRVHSQGYGWLGWAKNGDSAGSQGFSRRMEAFQIVVVNKGANPPGAISNAFKLHPICVNYQTYINGQSWQDTKADGTTSGVIGESKAIGAIKINIAYAQYSGGITYSTYMQGQGWQRSVSNQETAGAPGDNKRVEAVKIALTGELEKQYDIYYRVYVEGYGWLGWADNGKAAGTSGRSKRIEGIQIKLVAKGETAPGTTNDVYRGVPVLGYSGHVQGIGWQNPVYDGELSGTIGMSKRVEAIKIFCVEGSNSNIQYKAHVQGIGWQNWKSDNEIAGTTGRSKRIEAVQIKLKGNMADKYDVYYRIHSQGYGWLGWAKNGQSAGTEGLAKRAEGIQVRVVAKGSGAPGSTSRPFVKK